MRTFSLKYCQDIIERYVNDYEGEILEIDEGGVGLGTLILHSGVNAKTILITEVYLNCWSSTHKVRMYNKIPKKYEKIIAG
jgi:hypothetical protein